LEGHVHLSAGDDMWDGKTGDYVVIPPQRHSLQAVDDSVVMLTVFKSLPSV
jgi:quercetin dioxygenase-like cupin family protein